MVLSHPSKRRKKASDFTSSTSGSKTSFSSASAPSSPTSITRPLGYFQRSPSEDSNLHSPSKPGSSVATFARGNSIVSSSRATSYGASASIALVQNAADIQDREENDSLDEVIMAVDLRDRGTVGCCYYVAREEKLYLMEDVKHGGLEVVDSLKLHILPTIILLSSRIDESVETHLDTEGNFHQSANEDTNAIRLPYVLETRPSPEFKYEAGKKKLINLQLNTDNEAQVAFLTPAEAMISDEHVDFDEPGYTNRRGNILKFSAKFDIDSCLTIGCAGAVISYLQRRRAVDFLPGDVDANVSFRILGIAAFSLKDFMYMNADTLASLQILQSEIHPQAHNQGPTNAHSGLKEGLSVYGLFQHLARTPQGKYLLRQYFLRPSLNLDIINERLDTVGVFVQPDNDGPMKNIVKSLGQIKNMKTVVIHLRKGVSGGLNKGGGIKSGIWTSLRSFAFHTLHIRDTFSEVIGAENLAIRMKIYENFDAWQLARIGTLISQIVDFSGSAEMHRTVVNRGIDDDLDAMKQTYDGIEDLLNQTSKNIAATIPPQHSLDLNVIFFPQIGFLISIPFDANTRRGNYEGPDTEGDRWDCIFSTGSRVYYKDFRMRDLDDTIGDMYAIICDMEIEIIYELGQEVLKHEKLLSSVSDICGELDSLLALAQGAKMYKYSRPRLTTKNLLQIQGGRHPLQELTVSSYVANNAFLVGGAGSDTCIQDNGMPAFHSSQKPPQDGKIEAPSMLMMTGPNYSGKSVFLKQIALIVYLAHIGCFVPANSATIGLTDKILTRIATRETVSKGQSAFAIDLQQIALAMNLASHRSLVIIDEFGKGTESSDGAGLACGIFQHFLGLGVMRPRVLAATHFHEIFENGFLAPQPFLTFGHMEIRVDPEIEEAEHHITYLYNFRPGRSTSSFGNSCAAMNGVDSAVVARAEELVILNAKGEDLVAACTEVSVGEVADFLQAEDIAKDFLLEDLDENQTDTAAVKALTDPRKIIERLIGAESLIRDIEA